MAKLLKPGQLCTIKGKVYRCSKRTSDACLECKAYYGGSWNNTPCEDWMNDTSFAICGTMFGSCETILGPFGTILGYHMNNVSFPILVSMCKK